jgi:hypothetical protein
VASVPLCFFILNVRSKSLLTTTEATESTEKGLNVTVMTADFYLWLYLDTYNQGIVKITAAAVSLPVAQCKDRGSGRSSGKTFLKAIVLR